MRLPLVGPCFDIYQGVFIPRSHLTIEHIVPVSILKRHNIPLWDIGNLSFTDGKINRTRSNYPFSLPWEQPHVYSVDPKRRVFYPGPAAIRIVMWTIQYMETLYPELKDDRDLIILPDAYDQWK